MRSEAMDPSFAGLVLDPSKCSKLSMQEKRELVYELSKWKQGAPELLQSWSRKDLLELLCLEMGKERKYTGLTKYKLIEHLLKIVCEKKSGKAVEDIATASPSPPNSPPPSKRQRKNANPSRLLVGTSHSTETNTSEIDNKYLHCRNLACRATMSLGDAFCKRCSCCICYKYDDNKDPSLWLVCSSEGPSENSCGMSCHLECALRHEKAGIANSAPPTKLDGGFYCVSCGKVNDLLGCWRKQLAVAKDARRVDILCYRVSLSHKLLNGTVKFQNLHEIVDSAVRKLEAEVGALDGLPIKMARGIVNRLSSGAEVQKLCASAISLLDSIRSTESHLPPPPKNLKSCIPSTIISFEDVSSTSLTVGLSSEEDALLPGSVNYTLWHRRADIADYPAEPTCKLIAPERKSLVTDLMPATEYMFKVVAFSNSGELGKWEFVVTTSSVTKDVTMNAVEPEDSLKLNHESPKANSSDLSNPSEGDESNNTAAYGDVDKLPETCSGYCEKPEIPDLEKPLHSEDTCMGVIHCRNETTEQEGMPSHSVFAAEEEPSSTIQTDSHKDSTNSTDANQASDVPKSENESNAPLGNEMLLIPYGRSETVLPVTPSKLETTKEGMGRAGWSKPGSGGQDNWFPKPEEPRVGSSSKKRSSTRCEEQCAKDGSLEGDYEYCVKVIRWLECERHIETNFRVKFLTWFSLRATPQERRVVSVFVDTMIDDPPSLAGQLVDTFSEAICRKPPPPLPAGFCTKLWH